MKKIVTREMVEECKYCEKKHIHIFPNRSNEKLLCGHCIYFCSKYIERIEMQPVTWKPRASTKKQKPSRHEFQRNIRPIVLERDNNKCVQCGKDEKLHVHHKVARCDGGTDDLDNLITLCVECHCEMHPDVHVLQKNIRVEGDKEC